MNHFLKENFHRTKMPTAQWLSLQETLVIKLIKKTIVYKRLLDFLPTRIGPQGQELPFLGRSQQQRGKNSENKRFAKAKFSSFFIFLFLRGHI